MTVTLGYWDFRGRAEPIRFMLHYLNVDYKEVRYKFLDTYTTNFEELCKDWFKDKFNLGLEFPNIPYYLETDLKLTHSKAIMRYLGRKHGLFGQTESENIRIDMIENYMEDFRMNGLVNVAMTPVFTPSYDFETLKSEYISNKLNSYLTEISNFLDTNDWMAGNRLTYVDFFCYDILDWNRLFKNDCLNEYENLMDYMNRFEALPPINGYINSEQFNRLLIFAPFAKWGGNRQKYL